jgi:hypothetical protein
MADGETGSSAGVPLAEMIQTLRRELDAARTDGVDSEIKFDIEKIELELKVAVSRKKEGKAGIAFWVINVDGGAAAGLETAHTFKLTLVPTSGGGRISVSDSANRAASTK